MPLSRILIFKYNYNFFSRSVNNVNISKYLLTIMFCRHIYVLLTINKNAAYRKRTANYYLCAPSNNRQIT